MANSILPPEHWMGNLNFQKNAEDVSLWKNARENLGFAGSSQEEACQSLNVFTESSQDPSSLKRSLNKSGSKIYVTLGCRTKKSKSKKIAAYKSLSFLL